MRSHTPLWLLLGLTVPAAVAQPPAMMQGTEITDVQSLPSDLSGWLVSEKYDGVRAYWDGQRLLSRSGYPIRLPDGFTRGWPDQPLEGELWLGPGRFDALSALIRRASAPAQAWQDVRFMLFDLPRWPAPFAERHVQLQRLIAHAPARHLEVVQQQVVADTAALEARLAEVLAAGGEGLMLHRATALYQPRRSTDLRKFKPFQDAEARVVAWLPGQGKYQGMLGALLVERDDGVRFRLGSGFSDQQRRHPPAIGSLITYRYNGLTRHGKPRFARFLRLRPD